MMRSILLLFTAMGLLLTNCRPEPKENDTEVLGALLLVATATPYVEIVPEAGTFSIPARSFSRAFTPTCSGVPGNETFKFYLKRGSTKNLLINFMGGGACWDGSNCFGENTTTYFDQAGRFSSLAARVAFNGILEERNAQNPFKDWNVIFIPYCTGDLHWGSNNEIYTDPTNGQPTTIKHRGFDNVLSVLKFLQNSSEYLPDANSQVFVTGQSAGAYGAIFNFPYVVETIQEKVPSLTENKFMVLGDAGNGVVPTGFQQDVAVERWGADSNVAGWITYQTAFSSLSLGQFYNDIATAYPNTRVAQYTTAWDGNQRFFYNVQEKIKAGVVYSDTTDLWGKSDGSQVPDTITCSWRAASITKIESEAPRANYRSYTAAGDVHTISTSQSFFTEASGGQNLLDWYNQMIQNGSGWVTRRCSGACSPPATEESPNGIACL